MSYWVYLEKTTRPISARALEQFAEGRVDARWEVDVLVHIFGDGPTPYQARIGLDEGGGLSTKNPSEETLRLLAELAEVFGGLVRGEDGQEYSEPAQPPRRVGQEPANWAELAAAPWWAPIVAFVARWYEPLSAQDGLDPAAVAKAVARLGPVPGVVEELYTLLGRRADLLGRFDGEDEGTSAVGLLHPEEWKKTDGILALALESDWYPLYGFEPGTLARDSDPPVRTVDEAGRAIHPDCGSFSEFIHRTLLVNTAVRGQRFELFCDDGTRRLLAAGFEEPYPVRYPWSRYSQHVLAARGALVITTENAPGHSFAAVRTEEGRRLLESVDLEWHDPVALWRAPKVKRRW